MDTQVCESDWKRFRKLQAVALDRFCRHVLEEIGRLSADPNKNSHDRYLAVQELLQERDEQMAVMFSDPRRSTAWVQLARIRAEDLLTDDELADFSEDLRNSVQGYLDAKDD